MSCVRSLSAFTAPPVVLTKTASDDGCGFLMFFKHLSQLYQGLGSIDPPPYHEPEAIKFADPFKAPSPLFDHVDPSVPSPWERPGWRAPDRVTVRLTDTQLAEIHNSVTKGMAHPKITKTDTMVGLLARCSSEVEPECKPIDTISYLINVRAFLAPFPPYPSSFFLAPWNGYIPDQRSC